MTDHKENIHNLLYIQFKKGVNAAQASRNINEFLGQDVTNPRKARWWFNEFTEGHQQTKHKKGAGRPHL